MAQQVITTLIDDVTGEEATLTRRFTVDGTEYEIDMSDATADEFDQALAPYTSVARVSKRGPRPARRALPRVAGRRGAPAQSAGGANPADDSAS